MAQSANPNKNSEHKRSEITIHYVKGGHKRGSDPIDPNEEPSVFVLTRDLGSFTTEAFDRNDISVDRALDIAYEPVLSFELEHTIDLDENIDELLERLYTRLQGAHTDSEMGYDGTEYRSMSVGDIIQVESAYYMVDRFGFAKL